LERIYPGGLPDGYLCLDHIAEDLMFYLETHYYSRQMRPEVPEVLEAIRKMGLKIGLISNVSSRGQVLQPESLSYLALFQSHRSIQ
jgi:FMN phosphatase YigB (HAD superfamily)